SGAVEYAFSLPINAPLTGPTSGVFNSFNPENQDRPVFNWLSIYNPGDQPFNANVSVYAQDGTLSAEQSFSVTDLSPGARQDFALGHQNGQVAGLYEIVPEDATASYGAFITRY